MTPGHTITIAPSYRHVEIAVNTETFADLVWSYEEPIPGAEGVKGLMCFYNERVDIGIDGQPQVRPETPYSA